MSSDADGTSSDPGDPGDAGDGLPVVLAQLAQIGALAEAVMNSEGWRLSDAQACAAVREAARVVRKVQAAYLAVVHEVDQRPGSVKQAYAGFEARTLIRHDLNRTTGQAKTDVAAATALRPDADPAKGGLPRLAAAFAAGLVSREHVDVAVRAVTQIPQALLAAPALSDPDADPDTDAGDLDDDSDPDAGAGGVDPVSGRPACAGDVVDAALTRLAIEHDSYAMHQLCRQLLDALELREKFTPDACLNRSLRLHQDLAGMWILRGELDPASGALLNALLDQLAKPFPARTEKAQDGTLIRVTDRRTRGQRNVDALHDLLRAAQAATDIGKRGGEPPRITLITRPTDLAAARATRSPHGGKSSGTGSSSGDGSRTGTGCTGTGCTGTGCTGTGCAGTGCAGTGTGGSGGGGNSAKSGGEINVGNGCGDAGDGGYLGTGEHIDPGLLARLSCDSILTTALLAPGGAILDLGRDVRTATPTQRRALTARDKGCVIPGCTVPAAWCDAHHVVWWSNQGPTNITNLALLCGRHHTEVHLGMWILTLGDDGLPWVTPPDWLDSQHRPIRNTYFDDLQHVRDLGTQLRLNLDGPSIEEPDQPSCRPPRGSAGPDTAGPDQGSPDGSEGDGS